MMTMVDERSTELELNYTVTSKYALGVMSEYMRDGNWWKQSIHQYNLLKRWNMPDSQGNLYLMSGVGVAHDDDHSTVAGEVGIQADWEDRRIYTSYSNSFVNAGAIDRGFEQKARVGIAPYIGEYGDLHTWLMLQVEHMPGESDEFTITPLVRLFKGSNLAEVGVSDRGSLFFHFMIYF